jgi:hypothetical protein
MVMPIRGAGHGHPGAPAPRRVCRRDHHLEAACGRRAPAFLASRSYQRTSYLPEELAHGDCLEPHRVPVGNGTTRKAYGWVTTLPKSAAHAVVCSLSETMRTCCTRSWGSDASGGRRIPKPCHTHRPTPISQPRPPYRTPCVEAGLAVATGPAAPATSFPRGPRPARIRGWNPRGAEPASTGASVG